MPLLLISLLFSLNISASEVDSYTGTHSGIENSLTPLNSLANLWLDQVESSIPKGCSQTMLIQNVAQKFTQWGWSKFEVEITTSTKIKKISPVINNIYRDFPLHGAGAGLIKFLSPLFNIEGNYIGADKFSHFFNEGFNYFKIINWQGKSLEDAFTYGEYMENGFWGKITMGIYSYADLAANYSGYQFFNKLYRGPSPYFKCQNNRWVKVKEFTFSDYVNPSWDERVNCNSFRTDRLRDLFDFRVHDLESEYQVSYQCPLDLNKCESINSLYLDIQEHLISPKCRNKH